MIPARKKVEELADLCRVAAPQLEEAVIAFEKLKALIEAEGYAVIWHMHIGEYSLRKLDS